jgi:cytochrome c biogenesis protein CcmG, thiol:disulfide interchange protein DsbE
MLKMQFFSVTLRTSLAFVIGIACILPVHALEYGEIAPSFELPSDSGLISLADSKGKVVYLDFWASWCGPCRQSFPWMNELQSRFSERGLQIIAVNLDAQTGDAQKFLAQTMASFVVAYDPKGLTPRLYGVRGMPTSILIGRDGKILMTHMGFNKGNRPELEEKIRQALEVKK